MYNYVCQCSGVARPVEIVGHMQNFDCTPNIINDVQARGLDLVVYNELYKESSSIGRPWHRAHVVLSPRHTQLINVFHEV